MATFKKLWPRNLAESAFAINNNYLGPGIFRQAPCLTSSQTKQNKITLISQVGLTFPILTCLFSLFIKKLGKLFIYRCCRGKLQPGLCEIVTKPQINKTWLPNATRRLDLSAPNCPAHGNRKVSLAVLLPDIECSQQPVPWEMLCKSWWVIAAHSAKPSHENWDIKVWYAKEAILTLSLAHGCYYRCPAAGLRRKLHHLTRHPCSVASSLTFPRASAINRPGFKSPMSLISGVILGNLLSISGSVK